MRFFSLLMLFLTKFRGNVFWQPVYLISRIPLPDMYLIMMRHSPVRSWPFGLRASLLIDITTKRLQILPETGTVPYLCFCCSLEPLTLGEQNRLVSFPSDGKCLLRRKIFCQARQMFEETFFQSLWDLFPSKHRRTLEDLLCYVFSAIEGSNALK